jgi:hypothetical protein
MHTTEKVLKLYPYVWGKRNLKTVRIYYDQIHTDKRESFNIVFQSDNHVIEKIYRRY